MGSMASGYPCVSRSATSVPAVIEITFFQLYNMIRNIM